MFCCGYYLYTVIAQCLFMYRRFVLITGKPVKLIYENVMPFPFCAVLNHVLKIGAVVVRACHGSVDIGIENKYIFRDFKNLNKQLKI